MDDSLNQNQGASQNPNGQQPPFPQSMGQSGPMPPPQPQYQPPAPQPGPVSPQQPANQPAEGPQRPPLRIDDALLTELGLGALPEDERKALQKHIYETLEMNVGMRLADQMTNEQLDEFEQYFNARDDAGAFRWLETNFPNYKDIVADEFEKLKAEVAQNAPQILATSQQQSAIPASDPSQQPPASQTPPHNPDTPPPASNTPPNFQ